MDIHGLIKIYSIKILHKIKTLMRRPVLYCFFVKLIYSLITQYVLQKIKPISHPWNIKDIYIYTHPSSPPKYWNHPKPQIDLLPYSYTYKYHAQAKWNVRPSLVNKVSNFGVIFLHFYIPFLHVHAVTQVLLGILISSLRIIDRCQIHAYMDRTISSPS